MSGTTSQLVKLSPRDFKSGQEVRWCPGCGDYSILSQFQKMLAAIGQPKESHVLVSGIGCSSRFPYYVDAYGIHSIHGRAPTIATGIKALRPDLNVWVITGDGDGLSIGGNHLLHALRRNVGIKILLFNNRIYGLTKGQYSPTSETGKRTKSSPQGSVESPLEPISLALTAGATFVARSIDTDSGHLQEMLQRMAAHEGSAFLEIYQNCPVFNDGAFDHLKVRETLLDRVLYLRHGEPLVYGVNGDKALALDSQLHPRKTAANAPDRLRMDETAKHLPHMLAELNAAEFPTPVGVFRSVTRPTYEQSVSKRINGNRTIDRAKLQAVLESGATWHVS